MATQVPVNLVNGGGALTPLQIKRAACKAFRQAVDEYCQGAPGSRGDFNDKFFEKLQNVTPHGSTLAQNMAREVPVLAGQAGTAAAGVAGTAANVAAANPGSAIAQIVHGSYVKSAAAIGGGMGTAAAGVITSCFSIYRMFGRAGGRWPFFNALRAGGFRIGFPDAMIGNQAIEIKGPGDSFRKNQKETFDAASKPNPTIVVDCKSCNANCKNGPVKKLKGKWKKNRGCP
ncbi:MAG: VRR-NUC domain-containing protein [Polyangiaceae bacterium]